MSKTIVTTATASRTTTTAPTTITAATATTRDPFGYGQSERLG